MKAGWQLDCFCAVRPADQEELVRDVERRLLLSNEVEHSFAHLLDQLFDLQPEIDDEGRPVSRVVEMSPGAKRLWIDFCNSHGEEAADLSGDLAAAWSKLEFKLQLSPPRAR